MKTLAYVLAAIISAGSIGFLLGSDWAIRNLDMTDVIVTVKNPQDGMMQMVYRSEGYEDLIVYEAPVRLSWQLDNRGDRTMYGKKECNPFRVQYRF